MAWCTDSNAHLESAWLLDEQSRCTYDYNMAAQIIDFRTGRILNPSAAQAVAPVVTADQAIREARDLVAHAYSLIRSEAAASDLVEVDALLEGLADALATEAVAE